MYVTSLRSQEISKSSKGKRPKEKEKATLPVARTKEKVAVQPKGQPKGQPQGQPKAQKERTPSVGSGDVSLPAVPKTTALSSELVKRRKVEQGWKNSASPQTLRKEASPSQPTGAGEAKVYLAPPLCLVAPLSTAEVETRLAMILPR